MIFKFLPKFPKHRDPRVIVAGVLAFLFFWYQIFYFFNLFPNQLFLLEMACWRLLFLVLLLHGYHISQNVPFFKDLSKELERFNEGPPGKSWFLAFLRRFHILILIGGYIFYTVAMGFFLDNDPVCLLLTVVSFLLMVLYLVQFLVYTKAYLKKSPVNPPVSFGGPFMSQKRGFQFAIVCLECIKVGGALIITVEMLYKFPFGLASVSPWRNEAMNAAFDTPGQRWTEDRAWMHGEMMASGMSKEESLEIINNESSKEKMKNFLTDARAAGRGQVDKFSGRPKN